MRAQRRQMVIAQPAMMIGNEMGIRDTGFPNARQAAVATQAAVITAMRCCLAMGPMNPILMGLMTVLIGDGAPSGAQTAQAALKQAAKTGAPLIHICPG